MLEAQMQSFNTVLSELLMEGINIEVNLKCNNYNDDYKVDVYDLRENFLGHVNDMKVYTSVLNHNNSLIGHIVGYSKNEISVIHYYIEILE